MKKGHFKWPSALAEVGRLHVDSRNQCLPMSMGWEILGGLLPPPKVGRYVPCLLPMGEGSLSSQGPGFMWLEGTSGGDLGGEQEQLRQASSLVPPLRRQQ